jgi:DEAD/DEAH box helicase domain-containing protein
VALSFKATIFKKIKFDTHENVGWGKIQLPPQELHTTSYWLAFDESTELYATDTALQGLANVLANVAPIYLMCDPHDVGVHHQVKSPVTRRPTIFVYDAVPGGVGFAEKLYAMHGELMEAARSLVRRCECVMGCPSCVGPWTEVGQDAKPVVESLLNALIQTPVPARS